MIRESLRRWFTFSSPARRSTARHRRFAPRLELLESRLAPATLVNPTTITFKQTDGDTVTVKISQGLLTAANDNTVFAFDTGPGGVNGSNATPQQLQEINL